MADNSEVMDSLSDEQLVILARSGDAESLVALAGRCVFIPQSCKIVAVRLGMEYDDLRQEAVIALMRALHSYDPTRDTSFRTFSAVCIRRRLAAAVRSGFRQKNLPMVGYLPLDEKSCGENPDPEVIWIEGEDFRAAKERIFGILSPFERRALTLYFSGCSYAEMAAQTGKSVKSIGNALARVRRKLRSEGGHSGATT